MSGAGAARGKKEPEPPKWGGSATLVRIETVSLNFWDLNILKRCSLLCLDYTVKVSVLAPSPLNYRLNLTKFDSLLGIAKLTGYRMWDYFLLFSII